MANDTRIGLALGSGAARGIAHVGVLNVLRDEGLAVHSVAGTSIGAVVGGAYAAGSLTAYVEALRELNWRQMVGFMNPTVARGGFFSADRLTDFLRTLVGQQRIEDLGVDGSGPTFLAVATDATSGEEVWLREGDLADAVRASFAIPGMFTPKRIGDRWFVDGAVAAPVPIEACRSLGPDLVIAVNLNTKRFEPLMRRRRKRDVTAHAFLAHPNVPDRMKRWVRERLEQREESDAASLAIGTSDKAPGLAYLIAGSLNTLQARVAELQLARDRPEIVIEPIVAQFGLFEFDRAEELIAAGELAAREALPAIRAALDSRVEG